MTAVRKVSTHDATTPLPPSDSGPAMEERQAAAAERAKKRRVTFDPAAGTVTIIELDGTEATYAVADMSEDVQKQLALIGASTVLQRAQDRAAAYAALLDGQGPIRAPREPTLDPWREAIAHTVVEETAGTDGAMTLDQAREKAATVTREKAATVTREKLSAAKRNPRVVAHHARLTGAAARPVTELL